MSTRTLQAVRLYAEAFEDLFAQCCSNPIKNAWGQDVDTTKLNAAHAFASRVLAGKPAPQPAAQQGELAPCDEVLFASGVSVGLFDIKKHDAEAICKGISAATGARVDWHYIGGRVHIKALPARTDTAQAQAQEAAPPEPTDATLHQIIRNVEAALDAAGAPAGTLVERIGALDEDAARLDWMGMQLAIMALTAAAREAQAAETRLIGEAKEPK